MIPESAIASALKLEVDSVETSGFEPFAALEHELGVHLLENDSPPRDDLIRTVLPVQKKQSARYLAAWLRSMYQ